MLQSFVVYTFTGLLLYILGTSLASKEVKNRECSYSFCWRIEVWLSVAIFSIIAGLRYNVGVDYPVYLQFYEDMHLQGWISRETLELGFMFILKLFTNFDLHFSFFFAFLASIQIFFVYYALRDRTFLLPYVGLFIMLGPFFLDWMNGIRQCIAICIFVYAVEFIQKRKLLHYIILIIIAGLFHKSAYILLFLYFIVNPINGIFNNRWLVIFTYVLCILIGLVPTWLYIVERFEGILQILGYDFYSENLQSYSEDVMRSVAWGPSRLGDLCISLMIFWYYSRIRFFYNSDKLLPYYFVLFFFGSCFYNLFINTSHIFLRPIAYFTIFKLPLTAYLLYYLKISRRKFVYFFLFFVAFTYIYFVIIKVSLNNTGGEEYSLYKFFFNHINF